MPSLVAPPFPAAVSDLLEVRLVDMVADAEAVSGAESLLTADELMRARRAVPAVHRRRVLLRAALRSAVAPHLGVEPAAVPLATTPAGRPEVLGARDLDVSCSASGGLGVVVVARGHRIGVDLERVRVWTADVLAEGWLAPAEQAALTALPLETRGLEAARAWTRKEAVLKARGTGLLDSPSTIVTPMSGSAATVQGWETLGVPVPRGWVASLAIAPLEWIPR